MQELPIWYFLFPWNTFSEHVTKIDAINSDDSQRKALIANSDERSFSFSKSVMLNSSNEATSMPENEQCDEVSNNAQVFSN